LNPDDIPNSPSEERRLLELMMQELRTRSHELVKQIEQLTQSLGERPANDEPARPSIEDDDRDDLD